MIYTSYLHYIDFMCHILSSISFYQVLLIMISFHFFLIVCENTYSWTTSESPFFFFFLRKFPWIDNVLDNLYLKSANIKYFCFFKMDQLEFFLFVNFLMNRLVNILASWNCPCKVVFSMTWVQVYNFPIDKFYIIFITNLLLG